MEAGGREAPHVGSRRAVILCGGRGTRLGGAIKPLLRRADGVTILDAIRGALEGFEITLAVTDFTRSAIVPRPGERVVIDPGTGPLDAIRAAAAEGWILAAPGDTPYPSRALVERLITAPRKPEHRAVCVRLDGMLQPLWALYDAALLRAVDLPPRAGPRAALERLDPLILDAEDDARAFRGVNTPEDARALGVVLS